MVFWGDSVCVGGEMKKHASTFEIYIYIFKLFIISNITQNKRKDKLNQKLR